MADYSGNATAQDRQRLLLSMIIVSVYFLVELGGGIWTNSLALVSDAGHMFSDVGALAFSLIAISWAARPPTPDKTYGYHRLEILAALINGLVLWGITVVIFLEAYHRLQDPPAVKSAAMLVVAVVGLAVNIFSAWLLFPSQKRSINLRSAFLHVLSDGLGSVAAIGASLAMIWQGWYWFDPLVSFFIGLLIIAAGWDLIQEAAEILMESTPRHLDSQKISQSLKEIPGILNIHDLHLWTITSGLYALSVHAVVDDSRNREALRCEMMTLLKDKFGLEHTTIQLEEEPYACPDVCSLRHTTTDT